MISMIDKIKQLKPCTYEWIADGTKDDGFIAQQVHKVFPSMIGSVPTYCDVCNITRNDIYDGKLCECCNWENPVQKDGKNYSHTLDYGKFTPYLTKALQEAISIIEKQQIQIELQQSTIEKQQHQIDSILAALSQNDIQVNL